MPWTSRDVIHKTKKAKSATAKRQWTHVANAVLAKTGNEGRAIREANAVAARRGEGKSNGGIINGLPAGRRAILSP